MKKIIGTLCTLSASLFLVCCSTKMGPIDSTVTVRVNLQTQGTPDPDTIYMDNWKPFYHYGDTLQYRLASYEDALAGRLTRLDDETTVQGEQGQVSDTTAVVFSNLNQSSAIVWIVQPDAKMYAWRQVDLVDGGLPLELKLFFRSQHTSNYIENKWNVVFREITVPVRLLSDNTPGTDTLYTADWKPFYHAGDTTKFELASYDKALAGKLTPVGGGTDVEGTAAEVLDTTRVVFPHATGKVIQWIVQPTTNMYAWRQIDLKDIALPETEAPLVFHTWEKADYEDNKWTVVVPREAE